MRNIRYVNIEREIGKDFVDGTLPSPEEICKKQLFKTMDDILKTDVDEDQIAPYMKDTTANSSISIRRLSSRRLLLPPLVGSLIIIRTLKRLRNHPHVAHERIAVVQKEKAEVAAAVALVRRRVAISGSLSTSVRQMVSIRVR